MMRVISIEFVMIFVDVGNLKKTLLHAFLALLYKHLKNLKSNDW
jgi:hypothetical protein